MLPRTARGRICTAVPNFVASIPNGWNLLWFQTLLQQIWHEYGRRNVSSSKTEDVFNVFTRVKMLVWSPWGTNCWKLRENILENILTAFSVKWGKHQPRPCRAFCYDYSLQPNSRHIFNSVTSITLSKTVSHGSQLLKYALAALWKDHQYYTFLWYYNGNSEGIGFQSYFQGCTQFQTKT